MAARQRREVMKKKKGTQNSGSVEENVTNRELCCFTLAATEYS